MSAILFGSISSLADTSELQREAFNRAFAEHGLSWRWNQDDYRELLAASGGQQRIADYAESVGEQVDAAAIHSTKSRLFQQSLAGSGVTLRDGVADTIQGAHEAGDKLALVSGTSAENIAALLSALSPAVSSSDFDVVLDSSSVSSPKPDKAAYVTALEQLSEEATDCVAIEDNVAGVQAAVAAGVTCVAFPNANTEAHDFGSAQQRVQRIDLAELHGLVPANGGHSA